VQPIVTDGSSEVCLSVCLSVCQSVGLSVVVYVCRSVTIVCCAKMAEQIVMLCGAWNLVNQRKHVLERGAYWHNLENTIEPSIFDGSAAFLSNYFTTYYFYNVVVCVYVIKTCLYRH